jgi:hypothetical protein
MNNILANAPLPFKTALFWPHEIPSFSRRKRKEKYQV